MFQFQYKIPTTLKLILKSHAMTKDSWCYSVRDS